MFEILHRDLNLKPIFHSVMSVCKQEFGGGVEPIPTLVCHSVYTDVCQHDRVPCKSPIKIVLSPTGKKQVSTVEPSVFMFCSCKSEAVEQPSN